MYRKLLLLIGGLVLVGTLMQPGPDRVTAWQNDTMLFFDPFVDELVTGWQWVNEDPQRWTITATGQLEIVAAGPSVLSSGPDIEQVNLLTTALPDGTVVITTVVDALPDENFKQAGLFLIGDGVNYAAVLTGFCAPCLPDTEGHGVYVEAFREGEALQIQPFHRRLPDQERVYLRLIYDQDRSAVEVLYAYEEDDWQLATLIRDVPAFSAVGLGAANAAGPDMSTHDLVARFDFLAISTLESLDLPLETLSAGATPVPAPTPTPLPEGILFRDDFDGPLLDGWTWINGDPARRSFSRDGWLELVAGDTSFFADGSLGMTNFLVRDVPSGPFTVTAHIQADPNENFQQATIFLFEDASNYVALNTGYCGVCPTGGPGFYMETFVDNNPFANAFSLPRAAGATDVYLRLENNGESIIGYYATEPGQWQRAGMFGNFIDLQYIGLGATNSAPPEGVSQDLQARFDYFEVSIP